MHSSIFAPDDIKPPASKDAYSAMTIRAARLPHRVFPVRQNGEHHQQTKGTPPASDTWSRPLPRDPDGPLAAAHPRQPPKNALGVSEVGVSEGGGWSALFWLSSAVCSISDDVRVCCCVCV